MVVNRIAIEELHVLCLAPLPAVDQSWLGFGRAIVRAGKPQVWLSVLAPFNEWPDTTEVAGQIRTNVDEKDSAPTGIHSTRPTTPYRLSSMPKSIRPEPGTSDT